MERYHDWGQQRLIKVTIVQQKKEGLFLPKILNSKWYNSHKAPVRAELQAGVDVEDPPDLADREHSSFVIDATACAPQKLKYVLLLKQERT